MKTGVDGGTVGAAVWPAGARLGRGAVGTNIWLSTLLSDGLSLASCSSEEVHYDVKLFDECGVICLVFVDFF